MKLTVMQYNRTRYTSVIICMFIRIRIRLFSTGQDTDPHDDFCLGRDPDPHQNNEVPNSATVYLAPQPPKKKKKPGGKNDSNTPRSNFFLKILTNLSWLRKLLKIQNTALKTQHFYNMICMKTETF